MSIQPTDRRVPYLEDALVSSFCMALSGIAGKEEEVSSRRSVAGQAKRPQSTPDEMNNPDHHKPMKWSKNKEKIGERPSVQDTVKQVDYGKAHRTLI